jgi:hypothetical protein
VRLVGTRVSGTDVVGREKKTIDTDLCFCLTSVKLTPPLARTLTDQNSECSGYVLYLASMFGSLNTRRT